MVAYDVASLLSVGLEVADGNHAFSLPATSLKRARAAPTCPSRCWPWLSPLLLLLAVFSLPSRHTLHKRSLDVLTAVAYRLDVDLQGRREEVHPAAVCCNGTECLQRSKRRVAVLTYVRDAAYFPLFLQLECTLRRSNPSIELAAMVVEGELPPLLLAHMRALNVTLLAVDPLEVENAYERRFSKNWLKVRALELTDYGAFLLVDADVAILEDISALFLLPTGFAAVLDQPGWMNEKKTAVKIFQGGVFFIRPCLATAKHMLQLVAAHPKLRFRHGNAEQEFFTWYFRYSAVTLPLEYNTMTHPSLDGNLTVGGARPKIVHFTGNKPFNGPKPGLRGHNFLCSEAELAARPQPGAIEGVQ